MFMECVVLWQYKSVCVCVRTNVFVFPTDVLVCGKGCEAMFLWNKGEKFPGHSAVFSRASLSTHLLLICVCVCMCACLRERENVRLVTVALCV